jgi:AcrR family transcriptional regulator
LDVPVASQNPSPPRSRGLSTPRTPLQDRSKDRVERVLDAAEELVNEEGAGNVTMQMISTRSGVGRASVYQFFPSILAVWKALALRYLESLQVHLQHKVMPHQFTHWSKAWDALIDAAVDFYHTNPLAQSILLGSDGTQEIRIADPEYDRRYAKWIAERFAHLAEEEHALAIEHLRVNVTCTTALFSLSVWEHGRITPFYASEAKRVSKMYTEGVAADSLRTRAMEEA